MIGIYGGYFGAAAGVMLLALMLAATRETLARSNALKNIVLAMMNVVAAVAFALLGPVHWLAVAPLALGLFAGGRLGPIVVRHSNPTILRTVIGVARPRARGQARRRRVLGALDRQLDLDVPARGVGVGAALVGQGHELLGGVLRQAGQLDVELDGEAEARPCRARRGRRGR